MGEQPDVREGSNVSCMCWSVGEYELPFDYFPKKVIKQVHYWLTFDDHDHSGPGVAI